MQLKMPFGKSKEVAQKIISKAINDAQENPLEVKENGCAVSHVLSTLSKEMGISEQDASRFNIKSLVCRS